MAWPDPRDDLAPDVIGTGGEDSGVFARWGLLKRWGQPGRGPWRKRTGVIAGTVVAATAIATAAIVLPGSHPAAHGPSSHQTSGHQAPDHHAAPATIASFMSDKVGPDGVFAAGGANGRAGLLAVQNIAGPGATCQPAVTLNGNDADPLFPDPGRQTPVGNPAFMAPGASIPGVGFAFIRVPANVDWVWLEPAPIDGLLLGMQPVTITACGQRFRLVGFAYPLTGTLRIHTSSPTSSSAYTVPSLVSHPRPTLADPQVDGVWQDMDTAHAQARTATLASGRADGQQWSIRLGFGTAGDCSTLSTSYIDDSANARPEVASFCGPVSAPHGPATIMALALGAPPSAGLGVGYVVSLNPDVAGLLVNLSTGKMVLVTPVVVAGRKYAAFFVPNPAKLAWLNALSATGRRLGNVLQLPQYGYTQAPL
jgi:hypothetical protein